MTDSESSCSAMWVWACCTSMVTSSSLVEISLKCALMFSSLSETRLQNEIAEVFPRPDGTVEVVFAKGHGARWRVCARQCAVGSRVLGMDRLRAAREGVDAAEHPLMSLER